MKKKERTSALKVKTIWSELPTEHRQVGNIKVDTGLAAYNLPVMAYIPPPERGESYRVRNTFVILGPSFVFNVPEDEHGDEIIHSAIINGQVEICHPLTAQLRAQMLGVEVEVYQQHEIASAYLEQAEMRFSEMRRLHNEAERIAVLELHSLSGLSPLADRLNPKKMGIINVYVITKGHPFGIDDSDMSEEFLV